MASVRDLFAAIGLDFDAAGFASAMLTVEGVEQALKLAGRAVMALGEAFVSTVTDTAAYADNLDETAQRVGVGVEALQALQYAADRSGSSAEQLTQALGLLGVAAAEAAQGGKEQTEAFNRLGISTKDIEKQPLDQTLRRIAQGLDHVGSTAEKTQLVRKLLGRGGTALLPMLANGGAELDKLEGRFRSLGVGMDATAVSSMAELHELLEDVKLALTGVGRAIGITLGPKVKKAAEWIVTTVGRLRDGSSKLYDVFEVLKNVVKIGLVAAFSAAAAAALILNGGLLGLLVNTALNIASFALLGATMIATAAKAALAWLAVAWPFIALGVLIGGLILLIDDLSVWAAGGKSIIGEMFGAFSDSPDGEHWAITTLKQLLDLAGSWDTIIDGWKNIFENFFTWLIGSVQTRLGPQIAAALKLALAAALPGNMGTWLGLMNGSGAAFGGGANPTASAQVAAGSASPLTKYVAPTMNSTFTINAAPGMSAADVGSTVDRYIRQYHDDKLREADATSGG